MKEMDHIDAIDQEPLLRNLLDSFWINPLTRAGGHVSFFAHSNFPEHLRVVFATRKAYLVRAEFAEAEVRLLRQELYKRNLIAVAQESRNRYAAKGYGPLALG